MGPVDATREILWNISHGWAIYPLFAVSMIIAGHGLFRRVRLWQQGKPDRRFDKPWERLRHVWAHALVQSRLATKAYVGLFHRFIFLGFLILTLATIVILLQWDFNIQLMKGWFYLIFQSLVVDIFGGLVLAGIIMAAARRWIIKPQHLKDSPQSGVMLGLLFSIVVSGFMLEGWRITITGDPWAVWSPVGNLFAALSGRLMDPSDMLAAHRVTWWMHMLLTFSLIAWAPYSRLLHVVTSPLNIFTANHGPLGGNLRSMDFDETDVLGVDSIGDFSWKGLLDLDACTGCGRCTEACPAATVGKELSPADLIFRLQDTMVGHNTDGGLVDPSGAIGSQPLWECTTCAACVAACPVFIEQMPKIVDLRRYQVMEKAAFPETIQGAVLSLESRAHPYQGTRATRTDWIGDLEIPLVSEDKACDVLLWVGSAGALLERNQMVTQALANLLITAGVDFRVLGREEQSTGDLARRVGNEYLFQSMALDNIAQLKSIRFSKIVTACPHAYNTFKNEYPTLGGEFEVVHHTQYLRQLLDEKRLKVTHPLNMEIVFHDPCYLGRHNGLFDPPRQLLESASGRTIREPDRNRLNSFCCGGGGGMSLMEEPLEKRINVERFRQLRNSGAKVVATACPTCLQMLEDGMRTTNSEGEVYMYDVAEIMWQSICNG